MCRGSLRMSALLRPLRDPSTPRALAFFLLALPLGIFYFTFLMTMLSVGLATATMLVGLPILVGCMYTWRHLARMEGRQRGAASDRPGTGTPPRYV